MAPGIDGQSEPSGRPPPASQRTHWYEYVIDVPVHVPVVVESVDPATVEPETTGSAVFTGTIGPVTTAVVADGTLTGPSAFVAVTTTRSVEPIVVGDDVVGLSRCAADRRAARTGSSQRSHTRAKEIGGVPVQEPRDAVNVSPVTATPEIVGGDTFEGRTVDRAAAPVLSIAATAAAPTKSSALDRSGRRSVPGALPGRLGSDMVNSFVTVALPTRTHPGRRPLVPVRARGSPAR